MHMSWRCWLSFWLVWPLLSAAGLSATLKRPPTNHHQPKKHNNLKPNKPPKNKEGPQKNSNVNSKKGPPKAFVPPSITSLDPTIAIPEQFLEFADNYFMSKFGANANKPERVKNYEWVDQFQKESNSTSSDTGSFSLLSWNILAQTLYERDPNKALLLPWQTRLQWILNTLQDANADIVCLQEVEDDQVFLQDLWPALYQCGYDGVVQGGANVREIKRRKAKGERAHRVATFWKRNLFEAAPLLKPQGDGECHMARGRTLTSLLQTKDNHSEAILAVVNCHLEGHPNQYAARIRQLQHAFGDLATRVDQIPNGLVLAGDFNCELASSACSTYLQIGRVGRKGGLGGIHGTASFALPPAILESEEAAQVLSPIMEWGEPIPNEDMESVKPHAFRRNSLTSAYPPQLQVNLHFTYCARPFRPVSGLDQIWYSSLSLQRTALRRASSPTARNIILQTGLPEAVLQQPSDHLPVGALFEWNLCSPDSAAEETLQSECSLAGIRELIVVPDQPPPTPKPLSPIMAYAELDLLMSTCPYDSDNQRIALEDILDHKLPPKDQKPSEEEIVKLREIRDQKKNLLQQASDPVRQVLQRIMKLKKEVSKYEEEMGFA